jgi:6-phosphogluconolactonase
MQHDVLILADPDAVAEAAAEILVAAADAAVEVGGRFVLALSGGSTPRDLYARLARADQIDRVPWDRTWVLFGDERCVGPDDPDSNFRMAHEALLDRVPVPPEQVVRIEAENPQASRAAHFYEQRLRELFPDDEWPEIHLALLGMGEDGRTASLFPGTDALDVEDRWVTATYLADRGEWRVTLTVPALAAARQIVVLVTGERKADRVAEAFGDRPHGTPHPIERVVPVDGSRIVLLDDPAASRLTEPA